MNPLSVCTPTFNDAETIGRALESVEPIADEIVVLDSDSTDGTREIVSGYDNAVIHDYKFAGFADMFRTAAESATHDWVLFVDADEEVRPELRTEIRHVLSDPEHDAYRTTKRNRMWGKWMHAEHKRRPILARSKALKWDNSIAGEEWIVRSGFSTGDLSNSIHHYAYDTIDEYINKWLRYTAAEALDEHRQGRSPSIIRYYAKGMGAFVYRYIYEQSVLDGWQGLFFATMSSVFYPVVDAQLRRLDEEKQKRENWEEWWIDEKC